LAKGRPVTRVRSVKRTLGQKPPVDSLSSCKSTMRRSLRFQHRPEDAIAGSAAEPGRTDTDPRQSHPFTLSLTLATVAILQQICLAGDASLEQGDASPVLSNEYGFADLRATGTVLQRWAVATLSPVEDGMTQMCEGLVALRANGIQSSQRGIILTSFAKNLEMVWRFRGEFLEMFQCTDGTAWARHLSYTCITIGGKWLGLRGITPARETLGARRIGLVGPAEGRGNDLCLRGV
jgi:hypothetical protein